MTTEPKTPSAWTEKRDAWQAVRRGWRCRCPACGEGRIFGRFLKVQPACDSCGLALDGHRADDMPAYIVIMIVGHIVIPLVLFSERLGEWPLWLHYAIWPGLTLALSLLLIQPVKGALIGFQWAMKMHGFDPDVSGSSPALPSDAAPR